MSFASYEATSDTNIEYVRSHVHSHPNAAGLVTFKVEEALKGGCYELVIDSIKDKTSFSHLLAVHAQKIPVQLSYQTHDFTHWNGGCWLQSITAK
jgi:spore coat polysaccharide biosynthesis protein SpsF (cytidylyltransferase family)